jgi:IS5 family transposase
MLRTVNPQQTLWEAILPEVCLGMAVELEAVGRLLDDPAFFEPFRVHFHSVLGRPSVPIETYLRLMFLKHRYRLGFEPLCREVSDSISWQRFCRIPLGGSVPHPTTLMKITTRCGSSAVCGLNEALLAKAEAAKVLKTNRVRADTTVVPASQCRSDFSTSRRACGFPLVAAYRRCHTTSSAWRRIPKRFSTRRLNSFRLCPSSF